MAAKRRWYDMNILSITSAKRRAVIGGDPAAEARQEEIGGLVMIDGRLYQATTHQGEDGTGMALAAVHLSTQISESEFVCLSCGTINTVVEEVVPSSGGTSENTERCTKCGAWAARA